MSIKTPLRNVLLPAMLALGACDVTSPAPEPLRIELAGLDSAMALLVQDGNWIGCPVELTATASGGDRDEVAHWTGASVRFHGFDEARDTVVAHAQDWTPLNTAAFWGTETIQAGPDHAITGDRELGLAHEPLDGWTATLEFSYEAERGEVWTPAFRFTCVLDPEYDPADASFTCDRWSPTRPRADRVLVDLRVGDDCCHEPAPESVARVEAAGGEILHEFNVPLIRTDIPTDSVPAVASQAHRVGDPERFDAHVIVRFERAPETADSLRFVELGGTVRHFWTTGTVLGMSGMLPDSAVTIFRADPDVQHVHLVTEACA